jgi:alkylation response protein AidB-like acyl-CoA dehydrogenase
VGHAALSIGGARATGSDDTLMKVYLYSRAQSVMGGTSQIQRNLVASRILHLPAP